MSKKSNLQIKSYQRFMCAYCDILTVSIRCHEFSPRFFGCLRLPKLFHGFSVYWVSLKTLLVATVKIDQWSLLYKILNGCWVQMKLIRSSYQIIDTTMPKIRQVMVSIILIKNFAHEDHEGDGPFKTEMNWVLELLLLSPF